MKFLNKALSQISYHKYLRCDWKYWQTQNLYSFVDFSYLKDIFEIIHGSVQTKAYSVQKTPIPYIRIGDMSYKFGIQDEKIIYLNDDADISPERVLKEEDLVLATIGTVGKIGLAKDFVGGTHSNNTVVLRKISERSNTAFYEKLFQSDLYANYFMGVVSQKAQPNLQQYDLENIRIPNISEDEIKKSIIATSPFIEKIKPLQKNIISIQSIIDSVLKHEFEFNYDKFEELKKNTQFVSSVVSFANNSDLRFSAKFHRPAGKFVLQELNRITTKKIKHYLAEPIVLGASVSPSDYDESGEYQYLSMATIKNWEFDNETAQYVSNSYSDSKAEKTIKGGDIILARSGEGTIGKVALIEQEDIKAVFADFTMRIRLKNYNLKFAYYYMRSMYFQYLIEIYKKGLGNNTNIFPIVVREFPLPDLSLEEQQQVVNEIQAEIDKQNVIQQRILSLRREIDTIIENAIMSSKN